MHFMKLFVHFQDCHVESEALGLENVVGIFAILGLAMIFTVFSLFLECFAKYVGLKDEIRYLIIQKLSAYFAYA